MTIRLIVMMSLLVLALAACGETAEVVPQPTAADTEASIPSPEPAVDESPLSPPTTPTPAPPELTSPLPKPASSPIEPPSDATDQVVAAAKAHLAEELGIALDDIETTAVEPVEWSDASLGCPEPGKAYAQVITPGYRIVLEVDEKAYELHTDRSGRAIVICER